MPVHTITVNNVRSYELFSLSLDSRTTVLLGRNGSGKTTLLEAIYYLHRGTSFRGRDRDMIAHDKTIAALKLEFDDGEHRRAELTEVPANKVAKSFTVNGKKSARMATNQRLPVVLFEPDELRLLSSSPARRRDFIDGIIARLSPTYSTVLSRFNRTLLQRNELLKRFNDIPKSDWDQHMFVWDVKLAELGASIIKARRNFIAHSNEHLSRIYSKLATSEHQVRAVYVSSISASDDALQQTMISGFERTRTIDVQRGYTSTGPHRDDVELFLNEHPAAESASRGEMRSIMLSFKLLEVELQEHHSGQKPLLLLDDVFSELDAQREQALISALSGYQTIITATDLRDTITKHAKVHMLS